MNHKKLLSNYLMIILLLCLKLNIKQSMVLKILTLKQMLQRLRIALVQVKAGNTSENLLKKIRQIIYCLYQTKEITKKAYNNYEFNKGII